MILCTGNPAHTTVASAVQRKFPNAEFASRATGYDLRFWNHGSEDFFRNSIFDGWLLKDSLIMILISIFKIIILNIGKKCEL